MTMNERKNHVPAKNGTKPSQSSQNDLNTLQFLDSVIENLPGMIFIKDAKDLRFVRVNRACEEVIGFSREELVGKSAHDIFPKEEADFLAAKDREVLATSQLVDVPEESLHTKNNGVRVLHVRKIPLLDANGTPQFLLGISQDITELKRAQEALRLSEERFRLLVSGVKDYAIFLLDPEGRVASWNEGVHRLKGYTAEEIIGQPISRFYTAADLADDKPGRALRAAASDGHFEDEGLRVRKDGSEFWANVVLTAMHGPNGELLGFTKITRDSTARKLADEALIRAKEDAERSNRFKDQFLSTMSHELRTPLNAVIGFSDLLMDQSYGDLNERQQRYVRHIQNGGKHLLRLINDILDLSKIEAGRLQLAIETVSVRSAFADVLDIMRPLADKKSQTFLQDAPPAVSVRADSTRFKQILLNLLGNAIKFTPEGGKIELGGRVEGDVLRVEVRDSGPGIPTEEQQRIFDAFYRLGRNDKATEGTGLGLAITRSLVELHGGQLGLGSQSGEGSCFFFTLPIVSAPAKEIASDSSVAPPADSSPRILVIEDDAAASQLLQSHLAAAGYEVVLCHEPDRAVDAVARWQPSAVTLDIVMRPINGWELLSKLKTDPRTSHIPVIVVTIVDEPGTGALLGADEYIVKPVDKTTLLRAVERCFERQSRTDRNQPILVVEDDAPTREFVAELLSKNGYEVRTAAHGAEARTRMDEFRPRLVILDLILPEISGFQLLQEWRADPRTADLPVFVLTSKDLTREEMEYLRTRTTTLFHKQCSWRDALVQQAARVIAPKLAGVS
jgi:PAS domain S-box-containing protein